MSKYNVPEFQKIPLTIDEKEGFLQEQLALGGYIDSAIKKILNNRIDIAVRYLNNALILVNKRIKSIRGF